MPIAVTYKYADSISLVMPIFFRKVMGVGEACLSVSLYRPSVIHLACHGSDILPVRNEVSAVSVSPASVVAVTVTLYPVNGLSGSPSYLTLSCLSVAILCSPTHISAERSLVPLGASPIAKENLGAGSSVTHPSARFSVVSFIIFIFSLYTACKPPFLAVCLRQFYHMRALKSRTIAKEQEF